MKKGKNSSGITLNLNQDKDSSVVLETAVSVFSCIFVLLVLLDMAEITINPLYFLPVLLIIPPAFIRGKWYYIGTVLTVSAVSVFRYSAFLASAKLVFNQIFTVSEKYQNYLYDKFQINQGSMSLFIIIVSALLALLISVRKSKIIPFCVLLLLAFMEGYYGILPSWIINVSAFVLLMLLPVIRRGKIDIRLLAVLLLVTAVLSATVFFAYPGQYRNSNPAVTEVGEEIRDIFSKGVQGQSSDSYQKVRGDSADSNNTDWDKGDDAESEQGKDNGRGGSQKRGSNVSTVHLNIVTVVTAFLLIIGAIIWGIILLFFARRRKKKLSADNPGEVIRFAFLSSLKLLREYGLELDGKLPSDYADDIKNLLGDDYARDFSDALDIWQESTYSSHKIVKKQSDSLVQFYKNTRKIVIKKSKFLGALRIKFIKLM